MKNYFFNERGLYYRTNELHPERPTLVFVHGLSGSSSAWFPLERIFETSYNIISPDLRGHGKSKKYHDYDSYGIDRIADDVAALVRSLTSGPVTLVGHSFGARVVLSLVSRSALEIEKVVFISPPYHVGRVWWMPLARFFIWVSAPFFRLLPFSDVPRGHVDYEKLKPTGDWSLRRIIPDLKNTTLRVYLYCLGHVYADNPDRLWARVSEPTLIVHGTRDSIVPLGNAALLSRAIPNSRLVLIQGGNHILPVNDAKTVGAAIADFMSSF